MSNSLFCPNCGSKTEFINGNRPNFCTNCGYNFKSLGAFGARQPQTQQKVDVEAGEQEQPIKLDSGDVDVNIPKFRKITGKDLADSGPNPNEIKREKSDRPERRDAKKVLEDFKSGASNKLIPDYSSFE